MTNRINIFFIVGIGRSGTTLLQTMFMNARDVCMCHESQFLGITWRYRNRLPDIRTEIGWRKHCEIVASRCEHVGAAKAASLLEELLASDYRSYGDLFRLALEHIARQRQVKHIGDKSPSHAYYIKELLIMIPDAKVVHIVRDPRDVAVSQREAWNANALLVALRWRRAYEEHVTAKRLACASRYTTVRYEDLVACPSRELKRLCDFLGVAYCDRMTQPHTRKELGFRPEATHVRRTLDPVTSTRVGRGLQDTAINRAIVERICKDGLQEFGYPGPTAPSILAPLGILSEAPAVAIQKLKHLAKDRQTQIAPSAQT